MPAVRRLAADMAGCWRLMGVDEKGMHQQLKAHRPELIKHELRPKRAGRLAMALIQTRRGFLGGIAPPAPRA
jgi:hypothetical protein